MLDINNALDIYAGMQVLDYMDKVDELEKGHSDPFSIIGTWTSQEEKEKQARKEVKRKARELASQKRNEAFEKYILIPFGTVVCIILLISWIFNH